MNDHEKEHTAYHEGGHAVRGVRARARRPRAQGHDPPHRHGAGHDPADAGRGAPLARQGVPRATRSSCSWVVASPRSSCSAPSPPARRTTSCAATEIARRMVREWGMSDRIGPMAWGSEGAVFLGEDLVHTRDYSDETARVIDEEVERILRDEENRARTTLSEHRAGSGGGGARRCSSTRPSTAQRSRDLVDTAMGHKAGGLRALACAPTAPRRSSRRYRRRRLPHRLRRVAAVDSDAGSLDADARTSELTEVGFGGAAGVAELGDRGPEVGGGERADERARARRPRRRRSASWGSRRARSAGAASPLRLGVDLAHRDVGATRAPRASAPRPWHESQAADENSATNQAASGRGKSARSSCVGTGYTSRGGGSGGRRRRHHAEPRRPRPGSRAAITDACGHRVAQPP